MSIVNNAIEKNIFNIDNIDIPIFRIFSYERFEELIKNQKLTLVQPSMWDDPYENFFLRTKVDLGNGEVASIEDLKNSWYGQCWTENEDTDAMWRIYSHEKDGVRVKTTARKLFYSIFNGSEEFCNLKYFMGKVEYKSKAELINFMETVTFSDIIAGGQNDKFAKLLCIKRTEFSHENEIRVIVDDIGNKNGVNGLYKIDIDTDSLFDEICLDPRLLDEDVSNLTQKIKKMGVSTKIIQSELYKLDIPMIRVI